MLQTLTLSWEDEDHEDKSNLLDRNITLTVVKTSNGTKYGISKISGVVEVR